MVYRAPRNKPFHEWLTQTRLIDGYFEGNFQEYELSLDHQIMALMIYGRHGYSESLFIPSYFRVEVLKTLRALKMATPDHDSFLT